MALFEGETGLSLQAAREEATRCLFCYDAPCVAACPTGIDVPGFIHAITTGNLDGSARTILAANPLGGTCARVCPVESLCEGACVRVPLDGPVKIGALQRVAMDAYRDAGRPFFVPGAPVGKRVAVVGAGPAGLACAAELQAPRHRRHDLRGAPEGRRARCLRHRPLAARARDDRPRGGRGGARRRRDPARHAGRQRRGGRGRGRRHRADGDGAARAVRRRLPGARPGSEPTARRARRGPRGRRRRADPARARRHRRGRAGRRRRQPGPRPARRRRRRRQHGDGRGGGRRPAGRRRGHRLLPPRRGRSARLPARDRARPLARRSLPLPRGPGRDHGHRRPGERRRLRHHAPGRAGRQRPRGAPGRFPGRGSRSSSTRSSWPPARSPSSVSSTSSP